MNRASVPLARSYLLLNHGPVTLVTSAHAGRRNVMAAAWAMPLDFDPPKVAVVIDRNTYTRELVEASGAFALNIPIRAQAAMVLAVGERSGRDGDKFAHSAIATHPATAIAAPLIDGCAAWLECRVLAEPHNQQRYDLFLAEVIAAHADVRLFSDQRWHFPDEASHTIHYVAGGSFFQTGSSFSVAHPQENGTSQ